MKEIYDLKMNKKENEERVVFIKKDNEYITSNFLSFIASDITGIPVREDYTLVIPSKDIKKYIECFKRNYISVVFYKDGKPEYEYNATNNRYDEFGDIYEMAFKAVIEINNTLTKEDEYKVLDFFERRMNGNILPEEIL